MVKWTRPAQRSLKDIHDFIAKSSPFYAKKVIIDIIEKTTILDDFPSSGRKVPELNSAKIRELLLYSYRIVYEITPVDILILAIIHTRKDFKLPKK